MVEWSIDIILSKCKKLSINEKCWHYKMSFFQIHKVDCFPSSLVLRRGGFGLGHLLKDGSNFFLFVITFPEIVESKNVFGNFLDFVHVDGKF